MRNLAFHSLLRWGMIILPILTTSLTHFSLKGWESGLFSLFGSERVNQDQGLSWPGWPGSHTVWTQWNFYKGNSGRARSRPTGLTWTGPWMRMTTSPAKQSQSSDALRNIHLFQGRGHSFTAHPPQTACTLRIFLCPLAHSLLDILCWM